MWQSEDDVYAIALNCGNSPSFTVTILADFTWKFFIGSTLINFQHSTCLSNISSHLSSVDLVIKLLSCIQNKKVCLGNPDEKFTQLRIKHDDNTFKSQSGMFSIYDYIVKDIQF
jgi:hypothetical protein